MNQDLQTEAFREGRRAGLALAAVASGALAFISLLGIEKAVLAIVLAVLAIRSTTAKSPVRRLVFIALGLAMLYIATFAVALILFYVKLEELIRLLQQMS